MARSKRWTISETRDFGDPHFALKRDRKIIAFATIPEGESRRTAKKEFQFIADACNAAELNLKGRE